MKNKIIIALSIALLCLFGCTSESTYCPVETIAETTTDSIILPTPSEDLSFADSLMELTAADGNRLISPYSAKMCLALLANGANGETKAQILDAIGIDDLDKYNADVEELLARYASYAGITSLETANSLWINQTVFNGRGAFLSPYRQAMQKFFSAEVREVTSANSIEEVNAWVNEKTKEKIPEILNESSRDFATALVNAVYFKAPWELTFEEFLTNKQEFNNVDGTKTTLDFMHNTAYYGYFENDETRAIKLDYGRWAGDEFISDDLYDISMYIMLGNGINVEKFLNEATFEQKRVDLALPKFKFDYSFKLNDILKSLGMVNAFDASTADFSKMIDLSTIDGNLVLTDALQKTYIGIDENGTEAAAVTALIMKTTGALIDPPQTIEFIADKPFYFAIRDNTSGELLFVGRYETAE